VLDCSEHTTYSARKVTSSTNIIFTVLVILHPVTVTNC